MKKLFVLAVILVVSCYVAYGFLFKKIDGLWEDGQGNYMYLGEDSRLAFPQDVNMQGVSWSHDGDILNLNYLIRPTGDAKQEALTVLGWGKSLLILKSNQGKEIEWKRSSDEIGYVKGSLMYRERMALPPIVGVRLQLFAGDTLITTSLMQTKGQIPLPFEIVYVKKENMDNFSLRAGLFYENEQLFYTPEAVAISKENSLSMDVLLFRGMMDKNFPHTELQNTYWRLVTLEGKPVQHFENIREISFIIRNGRVSGFDGCNSFNMSIKIQENAITFMPGASTMMMCVEGQEQTQLFMKFIHEINSWEIVGSILELKKDEKVLAVFEAVYF